MKKPLIFSLVLAATVCLVGEAWSGIVGKWSITGTLKATAPEYGITETAPVRDVFVFRNDHTFKMTGVQGTWRKKLDKILVRLNESQVEAYLEDGLADLGVTCNVALESQSFVVTPQADPKKIKGVFKATIEARCYGTTIQMNFVFNFNGRKMLLNTQSSQSDMDEAVGIEGVDTTLLDLVLQSLKAQLP